MMVIMTTMMSFVFPFLRDTRRYVLQRGAGDEPFWVRGGGVSPAVMKRGGAPVRFGRCLSLVAAGAGRTAGEMRVVGAEVSIVCAASLWRWI